MLELLKFAFFVFKYLENLLNVCMEKRNCPEHKIEAEENHEIQNLSKEDYYPLCSRLILLSNLSQGIDSVGLHPAWLPVRIFSEKVNFVIILVLICVRLSQFGIEGTK